MKRLGFFAVLAYLTTIEAMAQVQATSDMQERPPAVITVVEADQHLTQHKAPIYPPLAKAARVEGVVRLHLLVDSSGAVIKVLDSSGHPLLIRSAIEAAQQYRYRPFEVNGVPSAIVVEAEVSFSLVPLYSDSDVFRQENEVIA